MVVAGGRSVWHILLGPSSTGRQRAAPGSVLRRAEASRHGGACPWPLARDMAGSGSSKQGVIALRWCAIPPCNRTCLPEDREQIEPGGFFGILPPSRGRTYRTGGAGWGDLLGTSRQHSCHPRVAGLPPAFSHHTAAVGRTVVSTYWPPSFRCRIRVK